MRLAGFGVNPNEIDSAGASRRRTDVRYFMAQQGIDQAGFANVGTAEEGELRRTFRWKEFGVGSGGEKFSNDGFHSVATSLAEAGFRRRFAQIIADSVNSHHASTETPREGKRPQRRAQSRNESGVLIRAAVEQYSDLSLALEISEKMGPRFHGPRRSRALS